MPGFLYFLKCRPIKKHFYDFSERLCIAEPVVITGNKAMKVDSIHGPWLCINTQACATDFILADLVI